MKNYFGRFIACNVVIALLFFGSVAFGGQTFPGQNLWGITQQIAVEVDDINESLSINDAILNSKMDILVSFTADQCDLTSITEELVGIRSVVDKIDETVSLFDPSTFDTTVSILEVVSADLIETASLIALSLESLSTVDALVVDVAGISAQVSVVDSKLDQLSTSVFPVLSTLATASALASASAASVLATSIVGSKVDKLSTSIFPALANLATAAAVSVVGSKVDQLSTSVFPVLSTLATAAALSGASAASVLATSVVGSKVDQLSNSIFPVLSTLATANAQSVIGSQVDQLSTSVFPILANITSQVSTEPIPVTLSMTISTSGSYRLANNIAGTITINASNVTLDLNGYTITPTGATNGVDVNTGFQNIWVKNGFIKGGAHGVNVATNNNQVILSDLDVTGQTNACVQMIATNTFSSTISNFKIKDCGFSNANRGLALTSCFIGYVSNCVAQENSGGGNFNIQSCGDLVFEDCVAQRTSGSQFLLSNLFNCKFNRCEAIDAILGGNGFSLSSCTNCTVMSCSATNNTVGFINALDISASNLFVNNCALNNGTNYSGVTNAPLTSATDTTAMFYWKNYSA